ncbi:REP-associated tyrosine transposase [Sphaerothrix gracilis]|uniref:REP-associated tyrosine transposase n=1 Tax=Sphaerothrix gracilis TaxID=3151835 RepID=UPI0031FCE5E2
MTNYRRHTLAGGTYFFTLVTHQRHPWLCSPLGRNTLRAAFIHVKTAYPFTIDAMVLLPDHLHYIWTLPDGDSNYATRWRLIKSHVTKQAGRQLNHDGRLSESRQKRQEGNLWQRRFWEHWIRDEADYWRHCDYIHHNPVRHRLCKRPSAWTYSSFHRFVKDGVYPLDWGGEVEPKTPAGFWDA